MGNEFALKTSVVLQILAVGVLANALAYVPYNMLQAAGRPDLTGTFHLLELPVYLVLCLGLIPRWGIAGAALASTFRFVLDAATLFWAAAKYCHCSWRILRDGIFPRFLFFTCALGLALLGIRCAPSPVWLRLGLGVLVLGAHFLAVWYFVVEKADKPGIARALGFASSGLTSSTHFQLRRQNL